MSAFACEPEEGSEPEVGWRWAVMMSRDNDLVVVTQEKNRKHIEPYLEKNPSVCKNVTFVYHEYLPWLRRLKKRFGWLMLPYYTLWQWSLRGGVDRLIADENIDLIHHVTFASFRMPVFLRGRPVIWGPVGGADTAPRHLLGFNGPWKSILRERVRNWSTNLAVRLLPWIDPSRRTGGRAFASTPGTAKAFLENNIPVEILPTVGMLAQENVRKVFTPEGEPLKLLFVGRLHHLKGLQFLFEALSGVPANKVSLTIVGTGPQEEHLKGLVRVKTIEDRVDFVGFIPRPELPEIYRSHDLLVAPSLYESGGLSILEAFSFGLPAVALNRGGPALIIGPGCGTLVSVDGGVDRLCDEMRESILRYAGNRELLPAQGSAARKRLGDLYSWDEKRRKMQVAYSQVVGAKEKYE
ncbi:glycosyltransferase family 4 protein [Akkermansiaceae bacterium]|nr:glycosyltransferase family 4 protein [Akkermansiaceae bacterium]MDA7887865.1 glycosyltransferase family 4 protein [Akkermansiaceae bacterium]MDB4544808.1 glycosyltransferase family 4 protein [Akkermansiaceae bacterium]